MNAFYTQQNDMNRLLAVSSTRNITTPVGLSGLQHSSTGTRDTLHIYNVEDYYTIGSLQKPQCTGE
jgi:hypothetical protein